MGKIHFGAFGLIFIIVNLYFKYNLLYTFTDREAGLQCILRVMTVE